MKPLSMSIVCVADITYRSATELLQAAKDENRPKAIAERNGNVVVEASTGKIWYWYFMALKEKQRPRQMTEDTGTHNI